MTFHQMVTELLEQLNWPQNNAPKLAKARRLVNMGKDRFVFSGNWVSLIKSGSITLVEDTSEYNPFPDLDKVLYMRQTDSPIRLSCVNAMDFHTLVPYPTSTGDPKYYYISGRNSSGWPTIGFYPIPATDDNEITCVYKRKVKDLSAEDYDTGNISAITNGGTTVTGSGTSWSSSMAGRRFKVTNDGGWYNIASVASATSLTLSENYQGTSITSGTSADTYLIGEFYAGIKESWNLAILQHAVILATQYDQQYVDLLAGARKILEDLMKEIRRDNENDMGQIHVLKGEGFGSDTGYVHIPYSEVR